MDYVYYRIDLRFLGTITYLYKEDILTNLHIMKYFDIGSQWFDKCNFQKAIKYYLKEDED